MSSSCFLSSGVGAGRWGALGGMGVWSAVGAVWVLCSCLESVVGIAGWLFLLLCGRVCEGVCNKVVILAGALVVCFPVFAVGTFERGVAFVSVIPDLFVLGSGALVGDWLHNRAGGWEGGRVSSSIKAGMLGRCVCGVVGVCGVRGCLLRLRWRFRGVIGLVGLGGVGRRRGVSGLVCDVVGSLFVSAVCLCFELVIESEGGSRLLFEVSVAVTVVFRVLVLGVCVL